LNCFKSLATVDPHHQLRLVAEKLCARVERRYEKRLLQQREQDRADIDLKLADIRAEYSEQMEMRRRDLEREKARLEEQFAQKDRALRHKLELELSEKESALEITRKSLETRLTELTLSKEHLDRVKAEFHAKFAADTEMLNREWERVSARKEELRAFYRQEFQEEQQKLLERTAQLEKENGNLRRKIADREAEMNQMRSQLAILENLQEDLKVANERIRKEVADNYRLSRCNYEAGRLREENTYLKEELEQLKSLTSVANVTNSLKDARKSSDELYSTKMNELKMIIKMMGDKINSLTSERDYLRDVLRFSHKDVYKVVARLKKGDAIRRTRMYKISHQNRESTEDTSVSSTLSSCGSDLQKIRKRFSILDELAKTLETTVDCVNAANTFHDQFFTSSTPYDSKNYEEFCRTSAVEATDNILPMDIVGKKVMEESKRVPVTVATTNGASVLHVEHQGNGTKPQRRIESSNLCKSFGSKKSDSYGVNKETEENIAPVVPSTVSGVDSSFLEKLRACNESNRKLKLTMAPAEKEGSDFNVTTSKREVANSTVDEYRTSVLKHEDMDDEGENDSEHLINGEDSSKAMELDKVLVDRNLDSEDEIEW
uniref:Coiled-coil domain-containing protein 176 n=1 Tax=Angiostrongylus cantonensis TaxID=6313 RepID=A0A0K0D193_ANGCA